MWLFFFELHVHLLYFPYGCLMHPFLFTLFTLTVFLTVPNIVNIPTFLIFLSVILSCPWFNFFLLRFEHFSPSPSPRFISIPHFLFLFSLFIHLYHHCTLTSSLSSFLPCRPHSLCFPHVPSLHGVFCPPLCPIVLPPAPRVLYLGRRAGVGLLLRDLGGKWLRSQPASTGGEPLQCVSEDSQVDPDQHRPLWLSTATFSLLLPFFLPVFCFFPSFPGWVQVCWSLTATESLVGIKTNYCMLLCWCFKYMQCRLIRACKITSASTIMPLDCALARIWL